MSAFDGRHRLNMVLGAVQSNNSRRAASVTASMGGGSSGQSIPGVNRNLSGGNITGSTIQSYYKYALLDGIVEWRSPDALQHFYDDIYLHDSICGPTVDLKSVLPFSDFVLSGIADRSVMSKYARCVDALQARTLLPQLSVQYYKSGESISILNYDTNEGIFNAVLPQRLTDCIVTQVGTVFGMDPLVDLKPDDTLRAMLRSNDPRIVDLKNKIPNFFETGKGVVKIDPRNLLYLNRANDGFNTRGASIYRRVLPFYILEKAVLRGTIELFHQRQKPITHVTVGSLNFEDFATIEEITDIVNSLREAAVDPLNAILGTRDNVNINQLASAEDFLKHSDIYDTMTTIKLRAMNVDEDLISGRATFNTLERALTTAVDDMRNHRDLFVRRVLYEKVFPVIAVANDFRKPKDTRQAEVRGSDSNDGMVALDYRNVDMSDYLLPRLTFTKSLRPEGDDTYLNILGTLSERGVPIPLRMMAAAAGVALTDILSALDDDLVVRQRIADFEKKKPKGAVDELLSSVVNGGDKNRPSLRDVVEMKDPDTGRPLSPQGRQVLEERYDKAAAPLVAAVAERNKAKDAAEQAQIPRDVVYVFGGHDGVRRF